MFGGSSKGTAAPTSPRSVFMNGRNINCRNGKGLSSRHTGSTVRTLHRHQLLAQRQVLQDQLAMSTDCQRQCTTDDHQQLEHVRSWLARAPESTRTSSGEGMRQNG